MHETPEFILQTLYGSKHVIFDAAGNIAEVEPTSTKGQTIQDIRMENKINRIELERLIDKNIKPEYHKEMLGINNKIIIELENLKASVELEHLQEIPLHTRNQILNSSECVQRIIKKKHDLGIKIDDQALAIAYS